MNEEVKGGIEAGFTDEEVDQTIDPELVDDRDIQEDDVAPIGLPEYDPAEFEFPDDEYEYEGEDD